MNEQTASHIPSPFLFAKLSRDVHLPAWQKVNQDAPVENGISGVLTLEIETMTPTLIGGEQKGMDKTFFTTPDGKPAIPGTSLKGMVRGVMETITHSRLTQIEDKVLSFRDLRMPKYRDFLTETLGKDKYKTRTKSGWLKFEGGRWKLYSTEVYRIENSEIERVFNIKIKDREAEKIYQSIKGIQKVTFTASPEEEHDHSGDKKLIYAKATELNKGKEHGYLIFTGQINPAYKKPGNKHMNFIFQEPQAEQTFADANVIKGFLAIVQKKDSQDKSNIFEYLRAQKHPNGIPVFYLSDAAGHVTSMGLAQMYRIPYKHSIADLRPEQHKTGLDKLDFSTLLFGDIDEAVARKGRISFGLAKLIYPQTPKFTKTGKIVLGSPKPSFYPSYIDQTATKANAYNTYNDSDAILAGRKQYLIQKDIRPNIPKAPTDSVASVLHPIEKGHTFQGKVRFHNINPIEFGALLWAITLGEEGGSDYFHNIGMGKPYGFGKVKTRITQIDRLDSPNEYSLDEYLKPFYIYAQASIGSGLTLKEVKALHREVAQPLTYPKMEMVPGQKPVNEFNDIKMSAKKVMRKLKAPAIERENEWFKNVQQGFAAEVEAQKQQEYERAKAEAERKLAEKQAQELAEQQARELAEQEQRRQNRSPYEVLFEDTLNGEITKKTLETLAEKPELWQTLSPEDQIGLAKKIKLSAWFMQNKRKKLKDKFPSLLPLVDLVL